MAAGAAGKVIATYVERGSIVKKGAILARLDSRAVSAQAAQAAADARAAKAQAAAGQARLRARSSSMFEKGAISKADYDKAHTQCETSKWTVTSAEARKTLTAEALRDTEIRAPFSGMVVERAVTAGEYVRVDSRVVTLVNTDSLRVEITVPEADVALVRAGDAGRLPDRRRKRRARLPRQDPLRRTVGAQAEPRRGRRGGVRQRRPRAAAGDVRHRAARRRRAELPAVPATAVRARRDAPPRLRRRERAPRGSPGAGGRDAWGARSPSSAGSRPASRWSPS